MRVHTVFKNLNKDRKPEDSFNSTQEKKNITLQHFKLALSKSSSSIASHLRNKPFAYVMPTSEKGKIQNSSMTQLKFSLVPIISLQNPFDKLQDSESQNTPDFNYSSVGQ